MMTDPKRMIIRRVLSAAFCLVLLAGCGAARQETRSSAETLVRLAEDDPKSLDPQSYSDLATMRIAAEQFEGLTRLSATGEVELGLASSWQASPDGLSWRFRLREGLAFSDGQPITSETFVRVYQRLIDAKTAAPLAGQYEAIARVTPDDDDSVRIMLKRPFPALLELLAQPAFAALPLHRPRWQADRPMVASGAYRLRAWELNDHIALESNPRWHSGRPPVARVEWKPVTDANTALRLYAAGEADIVGDFPSARLTSLRARYGTQVHVAPYRGSYYFVFNTRRPPFNDPQVRVALAMAVERAWIANTLLAAGAQPAWSVVPPGIGSEEATRPPWADWTRKRRTAEARRMLAVAGYGPRRPLRFEIRFNSDTDHRRVAIALATMWKPLGVEARLLNSEASLHFASLRRGDFDLARSGWIGDFSAPENFLAVHRSTAGAVNYSGITDRRFDALLDSASLLPDPRRRGLAMRRAEAHLMSVMPVLPLTYYVSKALVSPRVTGWRDNLANVHPSRTLGLK